MYNLWWIVIGSGILILIGIVLLIITSNKKQKLYDGWWQKQKLYNRWDTIGNFIIGFVINFSLCFIITLLISIILPLNAKREYKEYLYNKQMIEMTYNSEVKDFENAGINSKIIELNQWVVKVKASKAQYGNWSSYCVIDVDGLEYIQLKNEEK